MALRSPYRPPTLARLCLTLFTFAITTGPLLQAQAPPAVKPDDLGRDNPRSAITGFLLACRNQDYQRAAQYLDLRDLSAQNRASRGPALARDLEQILNSAPKFSVLRLSRNPEGDLSDDPDPSREHVVTLTRNSDNFTLDLKRVSLQAGSPPIWLFSTDAVAAIPELVPTDAPPAFVRYLPPFLAHATMLETPLWKWIGLAVALAVLLSLRSLFDRLLRYPLQLLGKRFTKNGTIPLVEIAIGPARVVVSLILFRTVLQFINPSAIARLYIGRVIELIFVWAVAYFLIKLVELMLAHVEDVLNARQRYASRSMLHLISRAASVTIIVLAILLILSNWGYNTTTLVAGLGVGGIAVALAAQQTIANVFAGVSVIVDEPVHIGDFGKFGDLTGTIEDIGMRSTRIRTLGRTVVSVPNSNFAGLNIENYSLRDKMLFNTTLAVKRSTPPDQLQHLLDAIKQKLSTHQSVEAGNSTVRVTGLTSAAFNVEIFCYVLQADWDRYYAIQGELFVLLNEVLTASAVELA